MNPRFPTVSSAKTQTAASTCPPQPALSPPIILMQIITSTATLCDPADATVAPVKYSAYTCGRHPASQAALNALHRAGHLLGKVEGVQVMVGGGWASRGAVQWEIVCPLAPFATSQAAGQGGLPLTIPESIRC
ncbi:MAG: hypothetical protein EA402_00820 [Planctomycetota bacterium]|nr:MAG: hypothetical protein EA402_00820 [Planctomycetota bacterium]